MGDPPRLPKELVELDGSIAPNAFCNPTHGPAVKMSHLLFVRSWHSRYDLTRLRLRPKCV
jgi:hypothetical protein